MSRRRSSIASCQQATAGKVCLFCGLTEDNELEYGKLYELGPIVTHYYCLLLSSMMEQRGRDEQGILGFMSADIQKELRRGKRLACFHCKKVGATLGCCNSKCKRIFHLPCGLRNGSLHQFYGEFRSYCINHRPKQLIDSRVVEEVQNAESTLCYICYDNVNYLDILKTLWAPCCKKNAFFHRKCVQQLANSSGYFFKCPLCNNKKEFQEAMLEHGIFIPLQDASWELVPNAYQELLYRHNQCDAETCVCPKGRSHASSNAGPANKWELVLCRMCGSQGIHRHCGHLKWANSAWECSECQSILDKSPIVNRQIREATAAGEAENRDPRSGDLESDSELSVGQDSNQQTENTNDNPDSENLPTVKVRPGPLSYKMKEVMKVAQSKFSVLCGSISEGCHELSETSSSCDSAGLIPDNVSLSDVKFRVCGSDIVQVILYDKYRIDIKMDNTGSRSSRDSDSSPPPCSSFSDDFSDSQGPDEGIPPKRIRDFEFEENTLQEFPATSCTTRPSVNIPGSPSTRVTTRERAAKIRVPAKENLHPVIATCLDNERDDSIGLNRATSPFANDFRVLRHRKNSDKPKATAVDTCLNCKVSIDLKKIRDLVETKPHLFSKCDEADCEYKSREEKLTGICKIKSNKWLLVKSQSENDFYGVSTRSRLLYKSKSLENLSAGKESVVAQKKEETKNNRPSARTGLRRGLKRKCRFSMPCS